MDILRKLLSWINRRLEYMDELAPKKDERRSGSDRRMSSIGYQGQERRSGSDRRANQ
jgi:hypothetical protein